LIFKTSKSRGNNYLVLRLSELKSIRKRWWIGEISMRVRDLLQELEKLDQDTEIRINLTKGWRPIATKSIEGPIEPVFDQEANKLAFYSIEVDTIFEYLEGSETLLYSPTKQEVKYIANNGVLEKYKDQLEEELEQVQMALLVKLREDKSNFVSGEELKQQIDLIFDEIIKKLKETTD
jgi:hypothetical protein